MAERIIFHVDMNAFFASVEQQFNPALRGKPIVVCGNPKKRTVVAACSYEAKAFGVKNGMPVFEAKMLCPDVLLVSGHPEKYVDVAQQIFELLGSFTPQYEIFSIDEAWLDVTGTYRLLSDTPEALARIMKQRIRSAHGLTCSIGIGPNKLIAKLASDLQKPDGLVRIRQADIPAVMEQLPVEELCGVGARLKTHLNNLGIITCADLGQAPEALLVERFGVLGSMLKRMGQGIDERLVTASRPEDRVKSMGHAYTLPRDTANETEIRGTLLRLAERVARRLRSDDYQGRTIRLTVRYADFATRSHARTVAAPTDTGLLIYRTAFALFTDYCEPLPQRVRLLGISVSNLLHRERQFSLLADDLRREALDRSLDQLADRFGELTIVRASALTPLVSKTHGFLLKAAQQHRGLFLSE